MINLADVNTWVNVVFGASGLGVAGAVVTWLVKKVGVTKVEKVVSTIGVVEKVAQKANAYVRTNFPGIEKDIQNYVAQLKAHTVKVLQDLHIKVPLSQVEVVAHDVANQTVKALNAAGVSNVDKLVNSLQLKTVTISQPDVSVSHDAVQSVADQVQNSTSNASK